MDTALLLSGVVGLGIAAQWLAWYLKQPSILFLLLIGIIIGPVMQALGMAHFNPDEVMGDLLFPFISLGVAVILFEGSLTLEFDEIKQHGKVVQKMVSLGAAITIVVIALTTYLLYDVDPRIALLFGALVCVTGPTVIMPLLRSVRPNKNIANILKWEGIIIDPIGAIAVVLVYEYIISGGEANGVLLFVEIVIVASVIGMFGAWVLAYLMKRHMIPEYLTNVFTLAFVLVLFSLSNHIEHESGLLAVTVMGVALANWKGFNKDHILEFNESLTVLLISVLFIVLAARVELGSLLSVGFVGIVLLLVVMFIARPLAVWASSSGSQLNTSEKLMISWIGPRGIVAAAISSLFAIKLEKYNIQGDELLVPLVFMVIIGTVLIQGLGAKFVGNILKVREPDSHGVLIVGSNPVALMVAQSLKEQGFDVVIAHNNYTNIAGARMSGLRTYFGNPISEHAERHLDLLGLGHLFAMSLDKELNTLSEMHYRHEFGEKKIFRLKFSDEKAKNEREKKQAMFKSQWLFGNDITYGKLASMLSKKARIKITNITDSYTYTQYKADNKQFIPLYTIDKSGLLSVMTNAFDGTIAKDTKLVALVIDDEVQPKNTANLKNVKDKNSSNIKTESLKADKSNLTATKQTSVQAKKDPQKADKTQNIETTEIKTLVKKATVNKAAEKQPLIKQTVNQTVKQTVVKHADPAATSSPKPLPSSKPSPILKSAPLLNKKHQPVASQNLSDEHTENATQDKPALVVTDLEDKLEPNKPTNVTKINISVSSHSKNTTSKNTDSHTDSKKAAVSTQNKQTENQPKYLVNSGSKTVIHHQNIPKTLAPKLAIDSTNKMADTKANKEIATQTVKTDPINAATEQASESTNKTDDNKDNDIKIPRQKKKDG